MKNCVRQYTYLIIGGGVSAASAIRGIREKDREGTIGIITNEPYPCYERPMLSNVLWLGTSDDAIWSQHESRGVTFHLSKEAVEIRPDTQTVIDQHGVVYWYKQLLIATGCSPRELDCPHEGVMYLNSLSDYYKLRDHVSEGEEFVIVGAGVLGTELAAALTKNQKEITLIYSHPYIFDDFLPKEIALMLTQYVQSQQVRLLPNCRIEKIKKGESYELVKVSNGEEIETNGVIAAVGVSPNTALAQKLNLKCQDGIEVNRYLQTAHENIYAAGDVANTYSPFLGKRERFCHEDAAHHTGLQAGRNMAGAKEEYLHLPFYQSELFGFNYGIVGDVSNKHEVYADWIIENKQGTLFYLKDQVVVGGVLMGLFRGMEVLRSLISAKEKLSPSKLKGLITQ